MQENDKTIVVDVDAQRMALTRAAVEQASGNSEYHSTDYSDLNKLLQDDLKIGDVIGGKYRILSELQKTGGRAVYIVHPLDDLSQRFVVKIVKDSMQSTSRKRFLREAKLHSAINHDNIVKLVDYWGDASREYIVLEYIDGNSLKACCNEFTFDEAAAVVVAHEVACALKYVWDNFKMVHRDIKPENIMLNSSNYIKLLDFGISKSKSAADETYLTMDNTILGTLGYMSPEQFTNSKNVSIQSDMFSLGATLYFLLTGKVPFEGEDLAAVYKATCETPPDFRKDCPGLSNKFISFMNHIMQKDPEKRPASWDDVIAAITSMM